MASKHQKILNTTDTIAERFTSWLGSPFSIFVHTIVFIAAFAMVLFGVPFDSVLLILTTAVSLEAIYLALFIQMSVYKNTKALADVEEDIEEIAEDVEGIEKDIDEIQEDVDEIQEDVDEIAEEVVEEDGDENGSNNENNGIVHHKEAHPEILEKIQHVLEALARDVEALKNKEK